MKTFRRVCLADITIRDEEGTTCELTRGKEYLTSEVNKDGEVAVFTNYWVPVPVKYFAGEEVFTK